MNYTLLLPFNAACSQHKCISHVWSMSHIFLLSSLYSPRNLRTNLPWIDNVVKVQGNHSEALATDYIRSSQRRGKICKWKKGQDVAVLNTKLLEVIKQVFRGVICVCNDLYGEWDCFALIITGLYAIIFIVFSKYDYTKNHWTKPC